jgi:hypothetical protein
MPSAGMPVCHGLDRVGNLRALAVVGLDLLVDQRFHLVRVVGAEHHHAQVVAHERPGVMVLVEDREGPEEIALLRILDVRLEGEHPLGLGDLEDRVHQAEKLEVTVLGVARSLHHLAERRAGLGEHRFRVADDERADGGADDDQDLERLPEDEEVPAVGDIAAKHGQDNDDRAADEKHECRRLPIALNMADQG